MILKSRFPCNKACQVFEKKKKAVTLNKKETKDKKKITWNKIEIAQGEESFKN